MKRLLSFVALILVSAMGFAASITANPSTVDFGEVSLKGKTLPVTGSQTVTVTWSGLTTEGTSMWAEISEGALDDDTNPSGFYVGAPDYVYLGYGGSMVSSCEFDVHYSVKAAGTFTGKLHLYSYDASWNEVHKYVNITITVTDDAIVAKTTPFERINTTSDLLDGDTIIFVSESAGAVCGPLYTTYLPAVTENVTINKSTGKADVPETAQMFVAKKYSGNWQFTTTDTQERLHLDITGKGAFTYAAAQAGAILASWGVSISNGVADVSRPDEGTFPVEFNGDRFKPYKSAGTGSSIALYKKAGAAQEVQSKLTVEAIDLGEVEYDETAEVTVNYTAEYIESDIEWDIEGTDKDLFNVTANGDRTSGTLKVEYLGGATQATYDAKVYAVFMNAQMDVDDASFDINIMLKPNTIKLTKLEFVDAPTTIDQGQSIDMSRYIVFTPNDAEDKSLTWAVDKSYQGSIDANGVLTAKYVTGNVTVTATSVRVPEVSASHTLTIVKPTVTDFTLSDIEVTLNVGGTKSLSVTAIVPDYASETPTYASSNKDVATVSYKGVITAKGLGDAVITATIGSVEKKCTVHVVPVAVESISLPASAELTLGSTLQLNPTVSPAQAASEHTIYYESDNEAVATVSESGEVKGVAEGEAIITATISDKSAQIAIHVYEPATFAKVFDPSELDVNDTIILATIYSGSGVIAGPRGTDSNGKKKLNPLTENVTVTSSEAYADNACRMVLGKEGNKAGYTLTIVGGKTIAVAKDGNDILDANTQNCKFWEFVADGNNGIYVHNLGNTNAYFKYHAGNKAIKPYKANTTGAVYIYVYVRKYVDPTLTGVDAVNNEVNVQKIIRDGQLLIIRNGEIYTVTGEKK